MNNNFVCQAIGNALSKFPSISSEDDLNKTRKDLFNTLLNMWLRCDMCDYDTYYALKTEIDETFHRCLDKWYPLV